ncbi:MAG: TIGR03984 family CRISPR-associated protein [Deltaproteobacteria bacterium]|nr:MAG: TIGR03984 family CRISPR-associated protein [Deltaproteobacteria bacterium]
MKKMKENGLELIELGSASKAIDKISEGNIQSVLSGIFEEKSFAVAYLDYKVLIGTWENSTFLFYQGETFENKHIQKLRVFNRDKEVLIWRSNGRFKGRLRVDENGSGTDVVIARQVLFGTRLEKSCNGNFTEITEDRGTKIILPFTGINIDDKQNRICIETYNYVGYNAVCQATYTDCRFVSFCDAEKDLA